MRAPLIDMAGEREFDVVVFGATGFTGKYVAEEVRRVQTEGGRSLTWAAAGRRPDKVAACLRELGIDGVEVLVADVSEQASLEAMCARTSVLINCVGPYQLYGEPVVKACINQKCDYVDITGETYFMETMVANYGQQAKDAGVHLISACGFDCIPNDLGALVLQKSFNGELAYVDSYMAVENSKGFNLGTWESFVRSIQSHWKLTKLRAQQNMQKLPFPPSKPPRKGLLFYSKTAHKWSIPFPGPDRSIVYRSQRYRHDNSGTPCFKFRTFFCMDSLLQGIGVIMFFSLLLLLATTNLGLRLLLKFPRFFSGGTAGTGPSREQMARTTFCVTLEGWGYGCDTTDRDSPPDTKMIVRVRGAEPGYVATSAMLVQSALCLLYEREKLPVDGGFYTPAAAFANTDIVKSLEDTGKLRFEVTQS